MRVSIGVVKNPNKFRAHPQSALIACVCLFQSDSNVILQEHMQSQLGHKHTDEVMVKEYCRTPRCYFHVLKPSERQLPSYLIALSGYLLKFLRARRFIGKRLRSFRARVAIAVTVSETSFV